MRKILLSILALSFTAFVFLSPIPHTLNPSFAQSANDLQQQLLDKQAEIEKLVSHERPVPRNPDD